MEDYILSHISPEPEYLKELYRETCLHRLYPHMCSGHLQGRLLKMLTQMINPKRVVEIGTYSGYSALAIAEGLREDAQLHTIEIDDEAQGWLNRVFAGSLLGDKITLHMGDALQILPGMEEKWDMAYVDGNKRDYLAYFDMLLPQMAEHGYLIFDNTLWGGKVMDENAHDAQSQGIKAFNDAMASNRAVETVILPVRDGLTLLRVK